MNFQLTVGPNGTVTIPDLKPKTTVHVSVKYLRPKRSGRQNNYYWGVMLPAILADRRFRRWTADQLHEAFKEKFLSEIDPVTGLLKMGSTADNDTSEQELYYDQIKLWAAENWDIYVPDPNEGEPR